jgi:hypothetical protein
MVLIDPGWSPRLQDGSIRREEIYFTPTSTEMLKRMFSSNASNGLNREAKRQSTK